MDKDDWMIYWLTTVVLLVAFSLILHFGLLSTNAGILRFKGVNAGYLFRSPLKSHTLTEFWSKRWNLAFSEMAAIVIFKLLKSKMVVLEKVLLNHGIYSLQHRVIGKIWTLFWGILPAPLLFHEAFIRQVVWPLAGITHISGLQ